MMGKHSVKVSQLNAGYGRAFLNVDDSNTGSLGVWSSSYRMPVYLMLSGINFHLKIYSDRAWAAEELRKLAKHYDTVYRIEREKLVRIK